MRRALGMLAALALAACQVDVEGARCSAPGTNAECPDGQACGNDNRCSERAAACVVDGTFCRPGQAPRCRGTSAVEHCSKPDAVCGGWVILGGEDDCASAQLECRELTPGEPACACRTPADFIRVDATAAPGPLAPTGADAPSQCRFTKLGDALAYAKDVWIPAHGGASVAVRALGTPAPGTPVVFDGESFPLVVAPGVTLATAAASPNPSDWVISANPGASVDVIRLHDGAAVEGFSIRSVSATGNGITVSCASSTPTLVRDVIVDGNAVLARGVSVSGPCGAVLERVDVSRASGVALEVALPSSASVTARGSRFRTSGAGIKTTGGILVLDRDGTTPSEVTDNTGNGVVLGASTVAVDATLSNVLVARNGGTGLFVNMVPVASKLTMISCDVHSNGTAMPVSYGPAGNVRTAGGMLLTQSALATFRLEMNRIYGNDGGTGADELAFHSSGSWPLTTASCATANAFGCVGSGLAVNVTTGSVDATYSIWPVISPPIGGDVTWIPECPGTAPACPPP